MRPDELLKLIRKAGGEVEVIRTKGSHRLYEVSKDGRSTQTIIAAHRSEIATGTLNSIGKDLETVLGQGWWK